MNFTAEQAWGVVKQASECDHHCDVPFAESDIATVYLVDNGCGCGSTLTGGQCNTYCDTFGIAVFSLKDGRAVVAEEWADTSGHG